MKPITAYQSFDGRIFEFAKECADYEVHCKRLSDIIKDLPKIEYTEDYISGKSYFQHDPKKWLPIRNNLILYFSEVWPETKLKTLLDVESERAIVVDYDIMDAFLKKKGDIPSLLAWNTVGYVDLYFRQWFNMENTKIQMPLEVR